ncbi:hypothetical protein BC937DRAFT_94456 [Endogone sp. FLAS-F59071]|nr:hypothetical protein BC937DRAFT_94456 [Endogone sp. FLAS-F59071]|eukprot:RUS14027.1 hypothetical protein BC937DRAFT_94456 [Endogone sp. FLAS-F59071]
MTIRSNQRRVQRQTNILYHKAQVPEQVVPTLVPLPLVDEVVLFIALEASKYPTVQESQSAPVYPSKHWQATVLEAPRCKAIPVQLGKPE